MLVTYMSSPEISELEKNDSFTHDHLEIERGVLCNKTIIYVQAISKYCKGPAINILGFEATVVSVVAAQ